MSEPAELIPSPPTSAMRNTRGRGNEQVVKNSDRNASDVAFREYCNKYYYQLLPIIVEKVHQEKVLQEKLKDVKARLNFEGCSGRNSKIQEVSQHSESRTPNVRGEHQRGRRSGRSRSMSRSPKRTSVFSRIRRDRSESPRHRPVRRDGGVFNMLRGKEKSVFAHSERSYQSSRSGRTKSVPRKRHYEGTCPRRAEMLSESEYSRGDTGSQNQKSKGQALKRTAYHNHGLGRELQMSGMDTTSFNARRPLEDTRDQRTTDLKKPTLVLWFDDLPSESVDSYDDLKKAFLANFLQQNKCIKDSVEIHHIKQREGESTEYFVQRFKNESKHVKGALKCMRISGFMHGITNPDLIKRLHDNISKSVDEMMRVTTTFLRGELTASNHVRKKTQLVWKQQEAGRKQNFEKKGDFRNQQRSERDVTMGYNTDECMHLRRQIEELIKAGKLSHVIKELKQSNRKDRPKATKKGEAFKKDKPLSILMVQPWQKVARQRITQSFSLNPDISFPPLGDEDGVEGLMIIEAEI
ncbi:reverse transcriptase domain-containing protein [Tanacetum coccineum]